MSKLFKFMAKAGIVTAIVVMLALVAVLAVSANGNPPDQILSHSSLLNKTSYWESLGYKNCEKVDYSGDGPVTFTLGSPAGLLVIKASTWHNVWFNPGAGVYQHYDGPYPGTISRRNISHVIYCDKPDFNETYFARGDCTGYVIGLISDGTVYIHAQGEWKEGQTEACYEGICVDRPTNCDRSCVEKKVFYWDDGWCKIRQRGGPIGGQTRPFVPMIYSYCGCGYVWGDWEGHWVTTCEDSESDEYTYWNELPQFCGYQTCE